MTLSDKVKGMCVLLVDDSEEIRNLVNDMLFFYGFNVLVAEGPEEAQRISEGKKFDLLFTDVEMPVMNGVELFNLISPERPEMEVLYMSGNIDGVAKNYQEAILSSNFIEKPFECDDLDKKLHEMFLH
ncbi:response regulator [Oryzomonas rubra]|uniref:Response regulator n=1 Tax=Oryzomonas rubra TaxID=2509454 RepID=A0A5A9XRG4_9BACT|nr:response regulator [Oryzomonas rubra]KAA0894211.1 response regulator [Oryzomonas rubra]